MENLIELEYGLSKACIDTLRNLCEPLASFLLVPVIYWNVIRSAR